MTDSPPRLRLAILISGAGSNMVAIARACAEGRIDATVAVVISDNPGAGGLERARELGLAATVVDAAAFRREGRLDRSAFEAAIEEQIRAHGGEAIVLAGFMRVLSGSFAQRHAGRMLNIHPSLLPLYPGLDTHARALAAGDRQHGVTVHFVTAELDGGPAVIQSTVPVLAGDDIQRLSARVHAAEHIIYPMAIQWLASGRLQWNGGRPTLDGKVLDAPVQHDAGAT
ncbi:MAG: phosphoribosylglycinamide formyltransferase [Steroidobacteraceae bacterium]